MRLQDSLGEREGFPRAGAREARAGRCLSIRDAVGPRQQVALRGSLYCRPLALSARINTHTFTTLSRISDSRACPASCVRRHYLLLLLRLRLGGSGDGSFIASAMYLTLPLLPPPQLFYPPPYFLLLSLGGPASLLPSLNNNTHCSLTCIFTHAVCGGGVPATPLKGYARQLASQLARAHTDTWSAEQAHVCANPIVTFTLRLHTYAYIDTQARAFIEQDA